MDREELKKRTKQFALDIIQLIESFPKTKTGDVIGRQLLRSGTSVGANYSCPSRFSGLRPSIPGSMPLKRHCRSTALYRAVCRARSQADFISKISVVEEEADESMFWLELAIATSLSDQGKMGVLLKEADELTAIFTASKKTARSNN
jgi:hypothetical protein